MYVLLPDDPHIDFIKLAVIFVSATLLGFASSSPGGLGVFDAAMLVALIEFEREELLAALEELAAWYRDLVAAAAGASGALVHADRAAVLLEDATLERLEGAQRAAELVRETWRNFEEFQLSSGLALEALFVELRRAFAGATALA